MCTENSLYINHSSRKRTIPHNICSTNVNRRIETMIELFAVKIIAEWAKIEMGSYFNILINYIE